MITDPIPGAVCSAISAFATPRLGNGLGACLDFVVLNIFFGLKDIQPDIVEPNLKGRRKLALMCERDAI